ncbi:beta-1,3-galactosyltransferase brn-like [Mytilus californianus]|uniref:beta-1,3-galactosyltransferase brn-like n=1 Tax=Mytilus californianus TaxID=6549 RepID=UPI002247BDB7|nr:beta-1,3-galactosyltransferase brn-like [Mytilus californianus]
MEYDLYEDMVQEDFIDEYKNNTLKTIMGFDWAVYDCSQAKFVLFVDDDYYVNIPLLLDLIENITESENEDVFIGFKYEHAVVRRKKYSKWYVSTDDYPNKHWPPCVSGGSIQICIADIYLGIVAEVLNITLTHDKRFEVKYVPEKLDTLITSHDYGSPNVLVHEWKIDDEDDAISTVEQNS